MSDLTEFLLARIAEDEELASVVPVMRFSDGIASHDPARVLAECEAKRRLVGQARDHITKADARHPEQIERSFDAGAAFAAHNTLLALAATYADHPDYRDEWRP